MKRTLILLFGIMVALGAFSQGVPVIDGANLVISTSNAEQMAQTLLEIKNQVNALQTSLDYIQKVNKTVSNIKIYKDLYTRQIRLSGYCIDLMKDAKDVNLSYMSAVSTSLQIITDNTASIVLMSGKILKDDFKMNDSERMELLDDCYNELEKQEKQFVTLRRYVSYSQEIKQNCESIKKFK